MADQNPDWLPKGAKVGNAPQGQAPAPASGGGWLPGGLSPEEATRLAIASANGGLRVPKPGEPTPVIRLPTPAQLQQAGLPTGRHIGPPHPYQHSAFTPLGAAARLNDEMVASVPEATGTNAAAMPFMRMVAGPAFGFLDAPAAGQLMLEGHPVQAANKAFEAVGETSAPLLAISAPASIPVMAAMGGANAVQRKGLEMAGMAPENAELASNLTSLAMGGLAKVVPYEDEAGTGMDFTKGINRMEQALSPARSRRFLNTRKDIEAAVPDLRRIARSGDLKGVKKQDFGGTLAGLMHDRAVDYYNQRHALIEPFKNVYTELAPVGKEVRNLANPGMRIASPETAQEVENEAARFDNNHVTLGDADSLRARFRKELQNRDFLKTQKSDVQDIAEAKHRGAVKAVEDAMKQLGPEGQSMRDLNMKGGRLDALGDRLAVRSIGSHFREPTTSQRLMRGGHMFVSAHGDLPYIGVFANPTSLAEEAFSPRGTNALVKSAMRNFGRSPRMTLFQALRQKFIPAEERPEVPEMPEKVDLRQRAREGLYRTLGLPEEGQGPIPGLTTPPAGRRRLLPPPR